MNGLLGRFRNRHFSSKANEQVKTGPGPSGVDGFVQHQPLRVNDSFEDAAQNSEQSEDLGQPSTETHRIVRKTSIAYTLSETLRDSSALAYFIQFMETVGQLNLVKFWLHVESFKASAATVRRNDEALIAMLKNDAGNIFAKYICADAPCSIGITEKLRKQVIDQICAKDDMIDSHCLDDAQQFVRSIMENRYFEQFLSSVYYSKHQLDVISSGALCVTDILRSQKLLCCFIEYLEGEGERKLIEFLIAAETFSEQITKSFDDGQAIEDAMIIYNKYFSMQATEPLKFGAKMRIQIESDICTESGRPSPMCFESARRLAVSILEQNYLKRFLASPPFIKFLYEIMGQIESSIELPNPNRKKKHFASSSDQSSEISLPSALFEKKSRVSSLSQLGSSASSALLPMGSNEEDETASQADSVQSFGPDGTPRSRHNRTGISLARIDDFGRYRPMYDNSFSSSEDVSSTRRKIKNTLDRYLHQSIAKEAEVADQVAQLIIADIHSMVSAGSSPRLPRK